jgi:uncharacterized membrane protein
MERVGMGSRVARPVSLLVLAASSLLVIAGAVPPAQARQGPGGRASCSPRIIDLGTLGGANSEIDGANRLGTWVGSAQNAHGVDTPVIWHDGQIQTLGESDGWAADITNAGVVVGNAGVDRAIPTAFSWYRGTARALPVPDGATSGSVRRINQHDDAVGSLFTSDGSSVPVEWQRLRTVRILPLPAGFTVGDALGINDAGDIVGDVGNADTEVAWEWGHDGSSHALQPEYASGFSQANLINDRGWAAGGLDFGGQFGLWAATWHGGSVSKLGQFGADLNFSFAFGQDQLGDYVGGGTYSIDDPYLHVFVTRAGSGELRTMLPLSGNLADPSNAHAAVPAYMGQPGIAVGGDSTTSGGDDHATVWTCAFRQAFAPPTGSVTVRTQGRNAAWKRMVDQARP